MRALATDIDIDIDIELSGMKLRRLHTQSTVNWGETIDDSLPR